MNTPHPAREADTDSLEQMLSMLLDGAVETLDISPDLYDTAVRRYRDVGTYLGLNESPDYEIYSQGSFLLGTVVRPQTPTGEYETSISSAASPSTRPAPHRTISSSKWATSSSRTGPGSSSKATMTAPAAWNPAAGAGHWDTPDFTSTSFPPFRTTNTSPTASS
ncbi:hypothetical protein [Streptomyces sp. Tu10]|uniref:hypothetical protein n=1 Tax=Streptomyces sp. Tu10 TaxID=2838018 RepID=UPI001BDC8ADA|nr:hypothetical protein [Streptomyces sp. Tu10]MBT1105711.1 hypothetical protein [Streptomyces sp. Tu10]